MSTVKHDNPVKIQGVTRGVCYAYLDTSDLSDEDTSQTVTWAALVAAHPDGASSPPANARITYAHANLIAVFSGGSVSACTLALGDAGDIDEQLTAFSVFTGATLGLYPKTGTYAGTAIEASYTPIVTVTTTDGNLADLDTGKIELALHYEIIDTARQVRVAG